MPLVRVKIENYKSIQSCDFSLSDLNVLIGENGAGKTCVLDAIHYFYRNLTDVDPDPGVFDENNHYSNQVKIALYFDLSGFVKISKSNWDFFPELPGALGERSAARVKYGGYYRAIIAMAAKPRNNILAVELSQIKGKGIRWNFPYEDRLIFRSLFPVFFIDTRGLDVSEWGHVWDVVGELSKVSNAERKSLEGKIQAVLMEDSPEMSPKLRGIREIFDLAGVDVKRAASKEFAQSLAKVFFSGERIEQRGRQLGYYSAGTNSVKYIELLLKAVDEIARTKLKEPIVLLDEPEIGLHPRFIDELSGAILGANPKLCMLVSTHSARIAKNIITESKTVSLYNVRLEDRHTRIRRMKLFAQYSPASQHKVTDDHVNSYFSRCILFVEGATELELFSNPYLRALYPALRYVDVYEALSDKPILNIMHPGKLHTSTPYLCLIDMDKAAGYSLEKKRLWLKREYFPQNTQERFQFRNKAQTDTPARHQRLRLEAMARDLRPHYYKPFYSCADPNYFAFAEAVHEYLLHYNVYTFTTTVEGALVNQFNWEYALEFLRRRKKADFDRFYSGLFSALPGTDQLNALRLAYNGKSDLWQNYGKNIAKNLEPGDRLALEGVSVGSKTCGWVSEYIDGFFRGRWEKAGQFSVKAFAQSMENTGERQRMLRDFKANFPELEELIRRICDMMKQETEMR